MYAMTVILYLGQGFFELLIVRHDCPTCPPSTGRHAKSGSQRSHTKNVFFGILEHSTHMNIFYLQSQVRRRTEPNVTEESGSVGEDQAVLSAVIYHSGQTGI